MGTVAVLAFKAVYNMEVKRRQNDKRIVALYVEMKDMIGVLTRCVAIRARKRHHLTCGTLD